MSNEDVAKTILFTLKVCNYSQNRLSMQSTGCAHNLHMDNEAVMCGQRKIYSIFFIYSKQSTMCCEIMYRSIIHEVTMCLLYLHWVNELNKILHIILFVNCTRNMYNIQLDSYSIFYFKLLTFNTACLD